MKTLIFVPTYNERDNAPRMCREIHALNLDADVLFVDDNSPDGTGELLEAMKDEFPRLMVQHRSGKLGIGSAHLDAIKWAYDSGYELLISLDCDFTHSPTDIPAMISATKSHDIAVGSRWLKQNSLPGWNIFRRLMTNLGHWLTSNVLGVSQDASGAFRAYRLDHLPREVFMLVKSRDYSFFFESLFIMNRNGFSIIEIPIVLPARTYGHSKMTPRGAIQSGFHIFELWFASLRRSEQFLVDRVQPEIDPSITDPQDWDSYWRGSSYRKETPYEGTIYELVAGIYRRGIIKRNLNKAIRREFQEGSTLLHAGCGSGQVDVELQGSMRITALDISAGALRLYSRNNPSAAGIKHGNIFELPFPDASFQGVYNLGVMEHFTREQIDAILKEFDRVLQPGGKIVLFWPHARSTSVLIFHFLHLLLDKVMNRKEKLHPAEISLMQSKGVASAILADSGFKLVDYRFGLSDFFVQAVIVGQKTR